MPLSVKTRIELYVPDQPLPIYEELLKAVVAEFTDAFGGCSVLRMVDGSYLSDDGSVIDEPVAIVYSDAEFDFEENKNEVSVYADRLRQYAYEALDEEEILVAVWPVYHSS